MAQAKSKSIFYCQNCGFESTKWMGQCPGCREWNTFAEEVVKAASLKNMGKGTTIRSSSAPAVLADITIQEEARLQTHIEELDRVLGGGIVQGSLTLVGGDPGIGKSTLLLQTCRKLAADGHKVLYISGRSPRYRSRCGRTVSAVLRTTCCCCVKPIWAALRR